MRRWLLWLLVGSVVVNATLGIAALLSGDFGDLERNVLYTSLCVTGAGVLGLACAPAIDRRRLWPAPWLGILFAIVGFALLIVAIWLDAPPGWVGQLGGTLLVAAAALAWASLVSLARLAPRFRWLTPAAVVLLAVLAGMFVPLIWEVGGDDEWYGRMLGVVAVLTAAFTLLVPILHRASRAEVAREEPELAVRFCPRCGGRLAERVEAGAGGVCRRCGVQFTVSFDDSAGAVAAVPDVPSKLPGAV